MRPDAQSAKQAVPKFHDFQNSAELSRLHANAPWWETVYRKAFPGFKQMMYVNDDCSAQRRGVDRVILLTDGKKLSIDEKVRTKDYPDFLLERWSDKARRIKGWIQKDLECDYIAYAFIPSQRCYLLPFQQLRAAWDQNGHGWIELAEVEAHGFYISEAQNRGYITQGVCVPRKVLLKAILNALIVEWES